MWYHLEIILSTWTCLRNSADFNCRKLLNDIINSKLEWEVHQMKLQYLSLPSWLSMMLWNMWCLRPWSWTHWSSLNVCSHVWQWRALYPSSSLTFVCCLSASAFHIIRWSFKSTEQYVLSWKNVPIFKCWIWCLSENLVLKRTYITYIDVRVVLIKHVFQDLQIGEILVNFRRRDIVVSMVFDLYAFFCFWKSGTTATWRSDPLCRSSPTLSRHFMSVVNAFDYNVWL